MTLDNDPRASRQNGRADGHLNGNDALDDPFGDQPDSGEPLRRAMVLEWAGDVQPREGAWIVKGLLPADGLVSFHGPSRAGKSFIALEWALRIACGDDVLGAKTRRVGVAYVAAEAANGVRKRIRAWIQENGTNDEFIPFALIGRGVDFSTPDSPDVGELVQLLKDAGVEFREAGEPLGIVFVDTLARATPGADENSSADMGAALAALERIGEALGVLVCVIHHTGKDASRGARGHSSFFAALDTAIELTHDEEAGVRTLKLAKQKDDEEGRSWGFKLKPVTIGTDSDGDAITSCVIEYTDAPTRQRRDKKLQAAELVLLDAVKAVLSNEGRPAPIDVPCPVGTYVVSRDAVREHAFKVGFSRGSETRASKRTAFNRAQQKLVALKSLCVWGSGEDTEAWLWLPKV